MLREDKITALKYAVVHYNFLELLSDEELVNLYALLEVMQDRIKEAARANLIEQKAALEEQISSLG